MQGKQFYTIKDVMKFNDLTDSIFSRLTVISIDSAAAFNPLAASVFVGFLPDAARFTHDLHAFVTTCTIR